MAEERGRSGATSTNTKRRRSLSRNKAKTDAASVGGDSKQVKTSRIKKMMKGLTRNKSKKTASDNMSSAVSVQAEEMSASTAPAQVAGATSPAKEDKGKVLALQLVLLLMDPTTRRFELLQLEFDSDKARVSDIIAQIPISVTEPSIRNQQYEGVVDESAAVMNEFVRLVDFCKGKTVLVALPKGLSVKECVRLARPILLDRQVERMLSAGQFDISGWKKKKDENKSRSAPTEEPKAASASAAATDGKSSDKSILPTLVLLVLIAIVMKAADSYLSAPIQVGAVLKPGTWKSKCGLLGFLPPLPTEKYEFLPKCTNSFLEVHDDGTVSIKDADKEIDVLMKGEVCTSDDCVQGLVLEEDGKVLVGGVQVKTAYLYGETKSLSPWPFENEPKLRLKSSSRR